MRTMADETRARVALGWAQSGLTQDEYAAQVGIAPRTLRLWLARYASRQPPLVQAHAVIADAVERLQALLVAVDAELGCPEPTDADRSAGAACDVGMEADATRHADLDSLVAGVQADLAKSQMTALPPAPNRAAASAAAATEGFPPLVEHQVERRAGSARPATADGAAPVSPEPLVSTPTVPDAEGGAEARGPAAVREHEAAGDDREVAGSRVTASEHVLSVADGAGPAVAPHHPAAAPASDHQVKRPPEQNGTPGVMDVEALRQRMRQRRAARAASGAPRRSPILDWESE